MLGISPQEYSKRKAEKAIRAATCEPRLCIHCEKLKTNFAKNTYRVCDDCRLLQHIRWRERERDWHYEKAKEKKKKKKR